MVFDWFFWCWLQSDLNLNFFAVFSSSFSTLSPFPITLWISMLPVLRRKCLTYTQIQMKKNNSSFAPITLVGFPLKVHSYRFKKPSKSCNHPLIISRVDCFFRICDFLFLTVFRFCVHVLSVQAEHNIFFGVWCRTRSNEISKLFAWRQRLKRRSKS